MSLSSSASRCPDLVATQNVIKMRRSDPEFEKRNDVLSRFLRMNKGDL